MSLAWRDIFHISECKMGSAKHFVGCIKILKMFAFYILDSMAYIFCGIL